MIDIFTYNYSFNCPSFPIYLSFSFLIYLSFSFHFYRHFSISISLYLHLHLSFSFFCIVRWPRDAAAKAATKNEFYPIDPVTNQRPESIVIFLRELIDEAAQRESVEAAARASIVHVYRGTRTLEPPPENVARFAHYEMLWRADVEKLACEQLLTAELLKNTQFVDAEEQARDRGFLPPSPQKRN